MLIVLCILLLLHESRNIQHSCWFAGTATLAVTMYNRNDVVFTQDEAKRRRKKIMHLNIRRLCYNTNTPSNHSQPNTGRDGNRKGTFERGHYLEIKAFFVSRE